jgi:phospholipid-binding lipoprotein MlaA
MIFRILIIVVITSISLDAFGSGGRCYHEYDPYENYNRKIYKFNRQVDRSLVRPFVKIYDKTMPEWGQQRVSSFFYNIKEPLSFINYTLQGDIGNANKTFWRFFVNTIFGIGGLFDFSSKFDLNVRQQTFSNTMMHYKMNYGAFLMVPFLGPSTTRDIFGRVVDTISDPARIVYVNQFEGTTLKYGTATAAELRIKNDALLDDIDKSSIDTYSKTRSLYLQSLAGRDPACEAEKEAINYNEDETLDYE